MQETRSLQDDRDAEVARVVRESNDRYHQMLAEKLTEIDQLEKDFERRLREANQSAASGADAQLKSALDRQQQEFEVCTGICHSLHVSCTTLFVSIVQFALLHVNSCALVEKT